MTALSAPVIPLRADDGRPRLRVGGHVPTAAIIPERPRAPVAERCAALLVRSRERAAEAITALRARLRQGLLPPPRPIALPVGFEGRESAGRPFPDPLPGPRIGLAGPRGDSGGAALDPADSEGPFARVGWSEQVALVAGLAALLAAAWFFA